MVGGTLAPRHNNNELYQPGPPLQLNQKLTGGTLEYSESCRKLRYESLEHFSGPLWTAGFAPQLYLTNTALHDGNIFTHH